MDFSLRPLGKACAQSGRAFKSGEECWSVLLERDGHLVREDISPDVWTGPPAGAVGHWKSTVPLTADGPRTWLDADSLFETFQQLQDSPNIVQQHYRYVLALLLLRKRRLILEEVIDGPDRHVMKLIGSAGEGPFEVPEEELTEDQIDRLQRQLTEGGRSFAA